MTAGVILAGGRGRRFVAEERNKVAEGLAGKPLVMYGVELFGKTVDKTVVVVGIMAETVKAAVGENRVVWAVQEAPRGTGDALKAAVVKMAELGWQPTDVVVGYGDHLMFYTPEVVKQLMSLRQREEAAMGMLTTEHDNPDALAWGRIVRSKAGGVERIVEQKVATDEERKIREVNPGFYDFDWGFLVQAIDEIKMNPVSGEYYVTDLVEIARLAGKKVVAHKVPFAVVGYGINTREELARDAKLLGLP